MVMQIYLKNMIMFLFRTKGSSCVGSAYHVIPRQSRPSYQHQIGNGERQHRRLDVLA